VASNRRSTRKGAELGARDCHDEYSSKHCGSGRSTSHRRHDTGTGSGLKSPRPGAHRASADCESRVASWRVLAGFRRRWSSRSGCPRLLLIPEMTDLAAESWPRKLTVPSSNTRQNQQNRLSPPYRLIDREEISYRIMLSKAGLSNIQ
jgi:hypothetical protein